MNTQNGVVRNSTRGGYDLYSNGKVIGWGRTFRDLKDAMQNYQIGLIYPDGSRKNYTVDISHKMKGR